MTGPDAPAGRSRLVAGRWTTALVAVATGLAWATAHPAPAVWWLVLFVVPGWLTTAALLRDARARVVFLHGALIGVAAFGPMLRWLRSIEPGGAVAWPLLVVVMALYVGAATLLVRPWTSSRWVVAIAPLTWTGVEVVRARWPLGGFGWGDLATAHTDASWMLTVARVLGADGLTLMTALLGTLGWATVRAVLVARTADLEVAQGRSVVPAAARGVALFDHVRPLLLGTIAVAALGTLVTVEPPPTTGEIDVLVVQGNDGDRSLTGAALDRRIAEAHADATVAAVEADGRPDLTVWAENALDRDPTTDAGADLAPAVTRALAATGGELVAGVVRPGEDASTFRNTIVTFDEDGSITGEYVKQDIVPFGEYVPLRPLIGDVGPLRAIPRDAVRGTGPVTLEAGGVRIAPVICFETLFAPTVLAAVADDDAGIVVAGTNDASFGAGAESAQHVAQSRLRAVETGRTVVHAAVAGTSAVILPDGTIAELAPLFEVATLRATVPVVSGSTPAMVVARPLSLTVLVLFAGIIVLTIGLAVRDRRSTRAGHATGEGRT